MGQPDGAVTMAGILMKTFALQWLDSSNTIIVPGPGKRMRVRCDKLSPRIEGTDPSALLLGRFCFEHAFRGDEEVAADFGMKQVAVWRRGDLLAVLTVDYYDDGTQLEQAAKAARALIDEARERRERDDERSNQWRAAHARRTAKVMAEPWPDPPRSSFWP